MPIQLPRLDSKTYQNLIDEMVNSIPKYNKEWTNFNPSDPGITILELLAYISEILLFECDQISRSSYINFMKLVAGPKGMHDTSDTAQDEFYRFVQNAKNDSSIGLDIMKGAVQKYMGSRFRAVTSKDFQDLTFEADQQVRRVEVNLFLSKVEIIIVTEDIITIDEQKVIINNIKQYLHPRLLIGTHLSVQYAQFTPVYIKARLICENYASADLKSIKKAVSLAVENYLHHLTGGSDKRGWQYHRSISVFELYACIEQVEGVKYVKEIKLSRDPLSYQPIATLDIDGLIMVQKTSSANESQLLDVIIEQDVKA